MVEAYPNQAAEQPASDERKEAYKLQIIRRILVLMALPTCQSIEDGAYTIQ